MKRPHSETETISELARLSADIDRLYVERDRLVRAARSEQHPWRSIAEALGVSRQAAWKMHRTAQTTVEGVRSQSDLSEAQAMALAKEAQHDARRE